MMHLLLGRPFANDSIFLPSLGEDAAITKDISRFAQRGAPCLEANEEFPPPQVPIHLVFRRTVSK